MKDSKKEQFYQHLGNVLRELREEKGFTMQDLANTPEVNISRSSLSSIELGKQEVTAYQLYSISIALGNKPAYEIVKEAQKRYKEEEIIQRTGYKGIKDI